MRPAPSDDAVKKDWSYAAVKGGTWTGAGRAPGRPHYASLCRISVYPIVPPGPNVPIVGNPVSA